MHPGHLRARTEVIDQQPFLQVIQLYTVDQQNIKYHLSWQQLANKENAPESDVHLCLKYTEEQPGSRRSVDQIGFLQ